MQLLQLSEDLARWGAYPTRWDTTDEDRGLTARPSGAGEAQRCLGSSRSLGLTIQMVLDRVWAHTPSSPSRAIQWCRQCRGVCPEAGGPLDTPGVWQGSQGKRDPCPLRPLPACPAGSREAGLTSAGVECGRQPPPGSSSSRIWTQPSGAELQEASSPSLVSLSSFSREKWATQAPPASRPTPRTLPWPKVCAVHSSRSHPAGFVVCCGPRAVSSGERLSKQNKGNAVQPLTSENLSHERSLPVG